MHNHNENPTHFHKPQMPPFYDEHDPFFKHHPLPPYDGHDLHPHHVHKHIDLGCEEFHDNHHCHRPILPPQPEYPHWHPPIPKGEDFVGRHSLAYLCELLKVGVDKEIAEKVPQIIESYIEENGVGYLTEDAITLEGKILKIRLGGGGYKEIDLSVICEGGGAPSAEDIATDADIDTIF